MKEHKSMFDFDEDEIEFDGQETVAVSEADAITGEGDELRKNMAERIWRDLQKNNLDQYFEDGYTWYKVADDDGFIVYNLDRMDISDDPSFPVFFTKEDFAWDAIVVKEDSYHHQKGKHRFGRIEITVGAGMKDNDGKEVSALTFYAPAIESPETGGYEEFDEYDYVSIELEYDIKQDIWFDEYEEELSPNVILTKEVKDIISTITKAINPRTKYR